MSSSSSRVAVAVVVAVIAGGETTRRWMVVFIFATEAAAEAVLVLVLIPSAAVAASLETTAFFAFILPIHLFLQLSERLRELGERLWRRDLVDERHEIMHRQTLHVQISRKSVSPRSNQHGAETMSTLVHSLAKTRRRATHRRAPSLGL